MSIAEIKQTLLAYAELLGVVAQTRGDLGAAEAFWRQSLTLFEQIGAAPQIVQVQD